MNAMTNAVAALLYNHIYDLVPMDGAWTVEDPRDDPSFLAFAEQLVLALKSYPNANDAIILQVAKSATNKNNASPHAWDTIVIDEEYHSLSEEADNLMPIIRAFITRPNPMMWESEFLAEE